jgi:hypothetical protein
MGNTKEGGAKENKYIVEVQFILQGWPQSCWNSKPEKMVFIYWGVGN